MNKKELIKDIIAFLILTFILVINIFYHQEGHESIFKSVIITISTFLSGLMTIGLFCYASFKIIKGKTIIYKDPNKPKTLENIDFRETLPNPRVSKNATYGKEIPLEKNFFLRKFMIFVFGILLLIIILFLVLIFNKDNNFAIILHKLLIFFTILLFLQSIYFLLDFHSTLWCYYVKFFRLLSVFSFLEKDFNKTINSHNYFPISVFYYKKQKEIEKANKNNNN